MKNKDIVYSVSFFNKKDITICHQIFLKFLENNPTQWNFDFGTRDEILSLLGRFYRAKDNKIDPKLAKKLKGGDYV